MIMWVLEKFPSRIDREKYSENRKIEKENKRTFLSIRKTILNDKAIYIKL